MSVCDELDVKVILSQFLPGSISIIFSFPEDFGFCREPREKLLKIASW